MKKITEIFVLAIASMAALASCSKDNIDKAQGTVLKASFEEMTKTSLGSNYQVLWSTDDKIVFFDYEGTAHTSTSTTVSNNGLTAEFGFGGTVTGDVALYPADDDAEYDSGFISTTLPDTQYPVAGGFDPKANIALSETIDNTAKFYNAGTLIGFEIKNDNIKEITLRSSKAFAGKCTVGRYSGVPEIALDNTDPSDLVISGDFVKGQVYYAVVAPNEYITFDLTFTREDGKVAKFENNNTLDLSEKRNCITMIFDSEIPDEKWETEAELETDIIVMKGFAGSSSVSYVTSFTEGESKLGVAVEAKQYIPSTGQIKGNQTKPADQFMIYNTEAFPGAITKIEIVAATDASVM